MVKLALGVYSSALVSLLPPATRTVPFGRGVAVCTVRASFIDATLVHTPVVGLYVSVVLVLMPPATMTAPLGRRVAVWNTRAPLIEPVLFHVPVAGSYNSAVVAPVLLNIPVIPVAESYNPAASVIPVMLLLLGGQAVGAGRGVCANVWDGA